MALPPVSPTELSALPFAAFWTGFTTSQLPPIAVNLSTIAVIMVCVVKSVVWVADRLGLRKEKKAQAKEKKQTRSQQLIDTYYFDDLVRDIVLQQTRSTLLKFQKVHLRCARMIQARKRPEKIGEFAEGFLRYKDNLLNDMLFLADMSTECYQGCARILDDLEDKAQSNLLKVHTDCEASATPEIYTEAIYKIYFLVIEEYKKWAQAKAESSD